MKNSKFRGRIFFIVITFTLAASAMLKAQETNDKEVLMKNLIESRHYIFNAESVLPSGGRLRFLNSGEQVVVNGDTLITDLPYFGRAYSAPIDPSQGGFHFSSVNYQYSLEKKRKGGWIVQIKPKDNHDVQQMTLDISTNGRTSLQVISNNRQSISFNGQVTGITKK